MFKYWCACLLLCHSLHSLAVMAPEPLQAWQQWIIDGQLPEAQCPYKIDGTQLVHQCIWARSLALDVTDRQLHFALSVTTAARVWVQLPGSERYWPISVSVAGREVPVVPRPQASGKSSSKSAGHPGILLAPGQHQVSGLIPINRSLSSLRLPEHRGIVTLSLRGKAIDAIDIDKDNKLWLQRQADDAESNSTTNSVRATVFRKLTDAIPMLLDTRLELSVSGKAREVTIGQIVPEGAVLTHFTSDLPARIEQNGLLRMQLRAGKWTVNARARYVEPRSELGFIKLGDHWPDEEIWAFAARPQLRGVSISGPVSIDPSQLAGPSEWRQLPTYRLASAERLLIEERYRGEVNAPANKLVLDKTIWVDFDGQGATVKDHLQGQMASGWRLSAAQDVTLGRATVNNRPQVITRLPDASTGVEIRNADIALETVSRLGVATHFSASGWREDVDTLSASLFLPPGWKIWHIAGPDDVNSSWLSRWNLWDIFICLLVVAAVANILGKAWSALSMVLLALVFHDATAPIAACALLLLALALLRVLPAHGFRKAILGVGYGLGLLVLLTLLDFAVDTIRQCIYPQLEYRQAINTGYSSSSGWARRDSTASAPAIASAPLADSALDSSSASKQGIRKAISYEQADIGDSARLNTTGKRPREQAAPENIQTGPGVPTWQWHRANLRWSGPVTAKEHVQLYLSPPLITRLLRLLQVLLMAAFASRLLLCLWQLRRAPAAGEQASPNTRIASATVLLLTCIAPFSTQHADAANPTFPPQYLLEEYQQRLLKKPDCATACYAINGVELTATQSRLALQLKISVLETIGVPLPRFSRAWHPNDILIDEKPAVRLFQQRGQWFLLLDPGVHQVRIIGPWHGEAFKLDFAQAHNVSVDAPGFDITGLVGNRLQSKSLTLSRKLDTRQVDTLFPDPIAPHIAVYRHLQFDQEWTVNTTVQRIAPATGSIHLSVPLLDGEKVRVDDIESSQGEVAVSLGNKQQQLQWQSVIEPTEAYTLINRSTTDIAEYWSLDASPRWHLQTQGLAAVKPEHADPSQLAQWRWRPLPGEQVTITATRPEPVNGPTTTVESAQWEYTPGERSSIAQLNLSIRSSIGRDYPIKAPATAVLEKLIIDHNERVLPNADTPLTVPLHPGLQSIVLQWRIADGVANVTRTPALELASAPSNIDLTIKLPRDRWPLLVGGPAMGPAMLFWGVVVVMIAAAALISLVIKRQALSIPLRSWHWGLLLLGLSTVNAVGSLWVVAWFFVLEARGRYHAPTSRLRFNLAQLAIVLLSLISAAVLLATIPQSLLSYPDMQVQGNGSHNYLYRWYQDHSDGALPTAWIFSLPIWVYRATMLLWSLWLVFALMRWMRWGWEKFSAHGWWQGRQDKPGLPRYCGDDDEKPPPSNGDSEPQPPGTADVV
jgi:hypothetical protein